jgi:hypothetical protein
MGNCFRCVCAQSRAQNESVTISAQQDWAEQGQPDGRWMIAQSLIASIKPRIEALMQPSREHPTRKLVTVDVMLPRFTISSPVRHAFVHTSVCDCQLSANLHILLVCFLPQTAWKLRIYVEYQAPLTTDALSEEEKEILRGWVEPTYDLVLNLDVPFSDVFMT